jgi:hypothetical protein
MRQEQQKMAGYSDPATRAAVARADEENRAEERRAAEATRHRAADARADMLHEKARRLQSWMAAGGDPEAFPWAEIQRNILMERQRRLEAQTVNVFK